VFRIFGKHLEKFSADFHENPSAILGLCNAGRKKLGRSDCNRLYARKGIGLTFNKTANVLTHKVKLKRVRITIVTVEKQ
jgi:hypothetical protein